MLIAVHCEDEDTIQENITKAKLKYGEDSSYFRTSKYKKCGSLL